MIFGFQIQCSLLMRVFQCWMSVLLNACRENDAVQWNKSSCCNLSKQVWILSSTWHWHDVNDGNWINQRYRIRVSTSTTRCCYIFRVYREFYWGPTKYGMWATCALDIRRYGYEQTKNKVATSSGPPEMWCVMFGMTSLSVVANARRTERGTKHHLAHVNAAYLFDISCINASARMCGAMTSCNMNDDTRETASWTMHDAVIVR